MNKVISRKIEATKDENFTSFTKNYQILNDNWNYKTDAIVHFDIANDNDCIFLKFFVDESNVKAVYTHINEPVYEDSCVEFFLSLEGESYYNFEFNCIGNILGGFGVNRDNREELSVELLTQIQTKPSLGKQRIEIVDIKTSWTLEVVIPKEVFIHNKIKSFKGLKATCNFYKCGDKQVHPHFLSWNAIGSAQPNFHLPEYFGEIEFS